VSNKLCTLTPLQQMLMQDPGGVFGPSASAAAVGKLLDLNATALEDALGTACTQACGLMSAQFGSMAKRMQHGFASRNGLFAALLAQDGYTGIHSVFEQPYGGFLQAFSAGSTRDPPYLVDELTKLLGQRWHTQSINVKPYATMAATHGVIDSIAALQSQYPERFHDLNKIDRILLEISEPAYK
jgi:aconitate decarboxylase